MASLPARPWTLTGGRTHRGASAAQADDAGAATHEISLRLEALQEQAQLLEEELFGRGQTALLLRELSSGREEAETSRADPLPQPPASPLQQLRDRLEVLEDRIDCMQGGGQTEPLLRAGSVAEALGAKRAEQPMGVGLWNELARLQNEVGLGLEELREQMAERLGELKEWQDNLEGDVQRMTSEALQTCNRLADDSFAVSEATQSRFAELKRWVEKEISTSVEGAAASAEKAALAALAEESERKLVGPPGANVQAQNLQTVQSVGLSAEFREDLLTLLRAELRKDAEQPDAQHGRPLCDTDDTETVDSVARQLAEDLGSQISRLGAAMQRIVRSMVEQQRAQQEQQQHLRTKKHNTPPRKPSASVSPVSSPRSQHEDAGPQSHSGQGSGALPSSGISPASPRVHNAHENISVADEVVRSSSAGPVPAASGQIRTVRKHLSVARPASAATARTNSAFRAASHSGGSRSPKDVVALPSQPNCRSGPRHQVILELYDELRCLEAAASHTKTCVPSAKQQGRACSCGSQSRSRLVGETCKPNAASRTKCMTSEKMLQLETLQRALR